MALKLWSQLNEHRVNGTHEMTFGVTDPIIASQMAKFQQVRYLILEYINISCSNFLDFVCIRSSLRVFGGFRTRDGLL